MRDYFETLCTQLDQLIQPPELWLAYLQSEHTGYCRFNQGKMRQQGSIAQSQITLTLASGQKHISHQLMLRQNLADDCAQLKSVISRLRERLNDLPEDPLFLVNEHPVNTEQLASHDTPDTLAIARQVTDTCKQDDFVGILVSGSQYCGFGNSLGQRNWFEARDYNLDYSLYLHTDKAVKDRIAGQHWQPEPFAQSLEQNREKLSLLQRPPAELKPGHYRVYLTPDALRDIVSMMGFSCRSVKDKTSPLRRLHEHELQLNSMVNISMDLTAGFSPRFQAEGFAMPEQLALVEQGASKNLLISPRTEKEYGLKHNGARSSEIADTLTMEGGHLSESQILTQLDDGLYISNLWYLNYSDPNSARITGMTRFACFTVENGAFKAPINALRFDDSVYHMLGNHLEALTEEQKVLMNTGSYYRRGRGAKVVPGALLSQMCFTL